jgi:hypothetical protein
MVVDKIESAMFAALIVVELKIAMIALDFIYYYRLLFLFGIQFR